MPEILVLSQHQAEQYVPGPDEAIISITAPGDPLAKVSEEFAAVHRVTFSDTSDPKSPGAPRLRQMVGVLAFVEANENARRLVIHCLMGHSRSAGLALGLQELFGWPRVGLGVGAPPLPGANNLVRRLVCDAGWEHSGMLPRPTPEQAARLAGRPDAPGI